MNRLGQSIYILTWFEKLFCPAQAIELHHSIKLEMPTYRS